MASKQYGLILPNKNKPSQHTTRVLNPLFNSDDELERSEEEESENALNWIEASLKKASGNSGQKSLQKRLMKEALDQDATVFQYDEVFDDMKATEQQHKEKTKSVEKKPKYIHTIIKHCEKRQLESERRIERKVQKEREAEGEEFADKEAFVTPSYLKKLEELKKAEEEHKIEQILEERNDVHRHKNFGVFYNHLLNQRVGESEVKKEPLDQEVPNLEHEVPMEATFSKKRTDQRKNIRPRMNPEDDSPERISVKREPQDSDDENRASQIGIRPRRRDSRYTSSDESRSISPERKRDPSRQERSPDRRRKQVLSEYKRNQVSKGRHDRSRSPLSKEDRSRGRHRKDRRRGSQSPAWKESIEGRRRSRSKERSRKESADENRRRERREREGEQRRKDDRRGKEVERSREGNNREKDKENKEDTNKAETTRAKQTISMTLGVTDVNKMNTEDRIQRFQKIFAKKTVGQVYEDAVQRYFQRKSERETTGLL